MHIFCITFIYLLLFVFIIMYIVLLHCIYVKIFHWSASLRRLMHWYFWRFMGCTLPKNCFWLQFPIQHWHVQIQTVICTYHAGLKHNPVHNNVISCVTHAHYMEMLFYARYRADVFAYCHFFFLSFAMLKKKCVSFMSFSWSSICCIIYTVWFRSSGPFILPWFCCL